MSHNIYDPVDRQIITFQYDHTDIDQIIIQYDDKKIFWSFICGIIGFILWPVSIIGLCLISQIYHEACEISVQYKKIRTSYWVNVTSLCIGIIATLIIGGYLIYIYVN